MFATETDHVEEVEGQNDPFHTHDQTNEITLG